MGAKGSKNSSGINFIAYLSSAEKSKERVIPHYGDRVIHYDP